MPAVVGIVTAEPGARNWALPSCHAANPIRITVAAASAAPAEVQMVARIRLVMGHRPFATRASINGT